MEDMMKALLDVVRAQHTATEGSEERPFDINDIMFQYIDIAGKNIANPDGMIAAIKEVLNQDLKKLDILDKKLVFLFEMTTGGLAKYFGNFFL